MDSIRVSVVIPTWNRGNLLLDTVQSVLNQTEQSFELLICDDGSTDNSLDLIRGINDHRVRWIPGAHHGRPAPARNFGILEAKGEWIAFLDSDDLWFPQKLEQQLLTAEKLEVLAICTNAIRFIPTDDTIQDLVISYPKDRITLEDLLVCNWVICSSMLVHSSIFSKAEGFPESKKFRAIEDYALWMRVASLTDIAYLSAPFVRYRDDPKTSIQATQVFNVTDVHRRIFGNFLYWSLSSMRIQKVEILFRVFRLWLKASIKCALGIRNP